MAKIKIAFFAEILIADFDGASRTMFQLIDRIDPSLFEFLFICGTGPDRIAGFECLKTPSIFLPMAKKYRLAMPMLSQNKIRQKLDNFAPDVIHIATPSLLGHFALSYAAQKHISTISIYHTHFISYLDYYLNKLPFLIHPAKKQMLAKQNDFYNRCDLVYVPSSSLAQELMDTGIEKKHLKLWKRGIDLKLFSPTKRDKRRLERITGNSSPCILFASRLVWEKNLTTLIAVYDLIQQEGLKYNLVIVGDGTAVQRCKQRMPKACFTGQLDHDTLSYIYASASVFVFPSVTETFGNVVLEAMASGLPCVIADGGGSSDFIQNGVNGLKCPANDAHAFLDRIRLIIENPRLGRQFTAAALQICEEYDWELLSVTYFDDLRLLARKQIEMGEIKKIAS